MQKIKVVYPLIPRLDPKDSTKELDEMMPLHIPSGLEFLRVFKKTRVPVRHGAVGMLRNYTPDPEYGGYPSHRASPDEFTLVVTTARELGVRHTTSLWAVSDVAKSAGLCLCKWHTGPATALKIGTPQLGYDEPITFVSRAIPNADNVMFAFMLYRDGAKELGLGAGEGDPFALVNPDRKLAFIEALAT